MVTESGYAFEKLVTFRSKPYIKKSTGDFKYQVLYESKIIGSQLMIDT